MFFQATCLKGLDCGSKTIRLRKSANGEVLNPDFQKTKSGAKVVLLYRNQMSFNAIESFQRGIRALKANYLLHLCV